MLVNQQNNSSSELKSYIFYNQQNDPSCIRARMTLYYSGIPMRIREVDRANIPSELKKISKKALLPALVISKREILDESIDMMLFALMRRDPEHWLVRDSQLLKLSYQLIDQLDLKFLPLAQQYLHPEQFDHCDEKKAKKAAERYLAEWEDILTIQKFLVADHITMTDIAFFPFIRQFSQKNAVDFEKRFPRLNTWLNIFEQRDDFQQVMLQYPA